MLEPRRDRSQAQERHDAIEALRGGAWQRLRAELKGSSDVERITARIALRQVRPRELVGLRQSLEKSAQLARQLQGPDSLLAEIAAAMLPPEGCAMQLARTIMEEPAALVRDGGVIALGRDTELDE